MLGGEVYVGFAFAQQLHGLAGFIFAKLINTVTLRTKPKVIGNHRALTVIKIFVSVKKSFCLPPLEEQPFGVGGIIHGHILRRTLVVLIGITAVKIGIVGAVDAGSDDFLGVLDAFSNRCGDFGDGFLVKFVLILCIQRHGLFQSAVFVYTVHRVPLSHGADVCVNFVFDIKLFEDKERDAGGNVVLLQRLVNAESIRLLQIGKMPLHGGFLHCLHNDRVEPRLVIMQKPTKIFFVFFGKVKGNILLEIVHFRRCRFYTV